MKKVVILGCENSHADTFLQFLQEGLYPDIEVSGIFSEDTAAAQRLNERFGAPVMNSFDEAVGKVDGVIVTARHGDNHYKYAAPYIDSGVPMFIDKPITISEAEAVEFTDRLKTAGVRVTGGSCCRHESFVQALKQAHLSDEEGKTVGGLVRAPIQLENPYGDFFFYAQHLVEVVLEIYGRWPRSVVAVENSEKITVLFRYDTFDITGLFVNNNYLYSAARYAEKAHQQQKLDISTPCFRAEFDEFAHLLAGGEQKISYEDFISPVFVMNAIIRSLESGKEEPVERR